MFSHDRHRPLLARRRYLAVFQAVFILILLGSQALSSLIYVPPVQAAGHPIPPIAHGSLTFQQFLKQGRTDGVYHGLFIRPHKSPAVPLTKGKGTDYTHLPPSVEPPTMQPIAQPLTTAFLTGAAGVAPLDLKGSDGRLEVQLQPRSLDLSHATVAKGQAPAGQLTLHITRQYSNFVAMIDTLGAYTVEVVDSTGQAVSGIVLRTPATFVYHYRPDELHNLDLDADHLNMTWPALIAAAKQAKQVTTGLLIPLHHDLKAHTLSGQSDVPGPGILSMGNGSSSEQSPPVPHLATVQGNTGQLSYSYPLQVPPGPAGFAPQLTLASMNQLRCRSLT